MNDAGFQIGLSAILNSQVDIAANGQKMIRMLKMRGGTGNIEAMEGLV